ncbi:hypothetical protein RIF29_38530 [Crotalaria pallida]|uniref:Uncharacterized protein n=1 Tax=Crotalaria pallida TaxID=3830 RepID=A0AAN9HLM1_CROPI
MLSLTHTNHTLLIHANSLLSHLLTLSHFSRSRSLPLSHFLFPPSHRNTASAIDATATALLLRHRNSATVTLSLFNDDDTDISLLITYRER